LYNYYVHYNGWNSSHDEWMREDVLDPLLGEERRNPENLSNPPPSRSSKSNHLIYDPNVSDRVIQNLINQKEGSSSPKKQAPLSPNSPAATKKPGRKPLNFSSNSYDYQSFSSPSEEEEAASELMELEYFSTIAQQNSRTRNDAPTRQTTAYRPAPNINYPMRADPGDGIAKILEAKRKRPHELDLIHRNRLHTHVLAANKDEGEDERKIIAKFLSSIKLKVSRDEVLQGIQRDMDIPVPSSKSKQAEKTPVSKEALEDPRTLDDIQDSLINLQSSLLTMQSQFKHTMRVLKKHHNVCDLPPVAQNTKKTILTRRSVHN
jgi:hypothetical protein